MEKRNFQNFIMKDLVTKMKKVRQKYKQEERQVKQKWNREKYEKEVF